MGLQLQIVFWIFVQYSIKDTYLIIEKNSCHISNKMAAIFYFIGFGELCG